MGWTICKYCLLSSKSDNSFLFCAEAFSFYLVPFGYFESQVFLILAFGSIFILGGESHHLQSTLFCMGRLEIQVRV